MELVECLKKWEKRIVILKELGLQFNTLLKLTLESVALREQDWKYILKWRSMGPRVTCVSGPESGDPAFEIMYWGWRVVTKMEGSETIDFPCFKS